MKRYLIVNYLPQNLTEKALYNLFAPLGPLESVKLMRDRKVRMDYCSCYGSNVGTFHQVLLRDVDGLLLWVRICQLHGGGTCDESN